MTAPACPEWCDDSAVDGHWLKISNAMPWETGHVRRFGHRVAVHVGHEIHDDGTQRWWPALVVVSPHRVETEDGCSQFAVPQALNLASRLAEAAAFALAHGPIDDESDGSEV